MLIITPDDAKHYKLLLARNDDGYNTVYVVILSDYNEA